MPDIIWVDVPEFICWDCGGPLQIPAPHGMSATEVAEVLAADAFCQDLIREQYFPGWICADCIRHMSEVLISALGRAKQPTN